MNLKGIGFLLLMNFANNIYADLTTAVSIINEKENVFSVVCKNGTHENVEKVDVSTGNICPHTIKDILPGKVEVELITRDRIGSTRVNILSNNTTTITINVKNGLNINNEIIWLVLEFNSIDSAINTLNLIKDPNLDFIRIYFKDSTVEEIKTQESNTHFLSNSDSELEISFR